MIYLAIAYIVGIIWLLYEVNHPYIDNSKNI
jgi:hypothetical protein